MNCDQFFFNEYRSVLIDLFSMSESHTAINLAAQMGQRIQQFMHKRAMLIASTFDGGRDLQAAAKYMHTDLEAASRRELQREDIEVDSKTAMVNYL